MRSARARARRQGSALLLVGALLLLTSCTSDREESDQLAVEPHLNVLTAQIATLPTVVCAQAVLPDGGVPGAASASKVLLHLVVDLPLGDPRVGGVLEDAGALVWKSPLALQQLEVSAFGGGVVLGPDGRADEDGNAFLEADQLTASYGPRPSLSPVQDPGSTRC